MNELKRNIIALSVIFSMLIAGWYFFIYFPISSELNPVEARITFIRSQMRKVEEMGGGISELIDDLEDARDSVMLLKEKMGALSELDSILGEIRLTAEAYDLQLQTLAPKLSLNSFDDRSLYKRESVSGLIKLPVDMRVRGDYLNFGKFMEGLHENGLFYSVEDLKMRRKVDELPVISFHIVMHLFLINDAIES